MCAIFWPTCLFEDGMETEWRKRGLVNGFLGESSTAIQHDVQQSRLVYVMVMKRVWYQTFNKIQSAKRLCECRCMWWSRVFYFLNENIMYLYYCCCYPDSYEQHISSCTTQIHSHWFGWWCIWCARYYPVASICLAKEQRVCDWAFHLVRVFLFENKPIFIAHVCHIFLIFYPLALILALPLSAAHAIPIKMYSQYVRFAFVLSLNMCLC